MARQAGGCVAPIEENLANRKVQAENVERQKTKAPSDFIYQMGLLFLFNVFIGPYSLSPVCRAQFLES